jgi:hypothetical protein
MPLGQGIAEILEAIPARIEVSGHAPTWRITGASFDAVLDYVHECFDEAAVLACHRRDRLWPRVTLTVTTDPRRAATAPALDELRAKALPRQRTPEGDGTTYRAAGRRVRRTAHVDDMPLSLETIFESQEAQRAARLSGIPQQREG